MHWLDHIVAVSSRWEALYPRLFPEGWGDPDKLDAYIRQVQSPVPVDDIHLEWTDPTPRAGVYQAEAFFESPVDDLPPSTRLGHLLMVSPSPRPDRMCLVMAAFNDHGYRTRLSLARMLAERGIATVMPENPFYGRRRANHHKQSIRTVLDLMMMGYAAVREGGALLRTLADDFEAHMGVSGYSMGGNIAALISAAARQAVATAPLAPSHSPGPVYSQGVLSRTVDWEALGGPKRQLLGEVLGSASVLNFEPPNHAARAILAAPHRDGYVPRQAVESLHHHWPGSDLQWLPGGHVSLWLTGKEKLAGVIERAFERTFGAVFST